MTSKLKKVFARPPAAARLRPIHPDCHHRDCRICGAVARIKDKMVAVANVVTAIIFEMSRRDGRAARPRSPSAAEGADNMEIQNSPPRVLARWTDERLLMVCQHFSNAPASLYRINNNWGKPAPPGVRKTICLPSHCVFFLNHLYLTRQLTFLSGRPRLAKNALENIEYGDLTEVSLKTVELLNSDQAYLDISANQPISLATVRTKIGEATSMATRLLSTYDSVDAAIADGQTELVLLAISVKTKLDASEARRTSKQAL